jgi:hypothetical protein
VGGWAGEWRLVCEIQWLEWVGLPAGEMQWVERVSCSGSACAKQKLNVLMVS